MTYVWLIIAIAIGLLCAGIYYYRLYDRQRTMASKQKRRQRQKYRVLKAQEHLAGLNPYDFAALMTALDDLEDFDPGVAMVKWPREPTVWEKIRQFIFGSRDAESN